MIFGTEVDRIETCIAVVWFNLPVFRNQNIERVVMVDVVFPAVGVEIGLGESWDVVRRVAALVHLLHLDECESCVNSRQNNDYHDDKASSWRVMMSEFHFLELNTAWRSLSVPQ